jgi:hypothetical protein
MLRLLIAAAALSLAASPGFACDWEKSASVPAPASIAAAQPDAQTNCPTCVVPNHDSQQQPSIPLPQKPS